MELYLLIDGKKTGPMPLFEVRDRLRAGTIMPDTKAWMRGMEGWQELRDLQPLKNDPALLVAEAGGEDLIVSDEERAAIVEHLEEKPRPWVRFWARSIDLGIFTALVLFAVTKSKIAGSAPLIDPEGSNLAVVVGIPAAWALVEAALLLYFQTTPGKWLLNITVRRMDGERLELGESLRRSISVWWRGWGIGILPLQIVCFALSHLALTAQGSTYWDARGELEIKHEPVDPWRIVLSVVVILATSWATIHLLGLPEELARVLETK